MTWERGQLEAVFGQVARRNLGQMATRAGSWENGHVSALLQRPVSMVVSVHVSQMVIVVEYWWKSKSVERFDGGEQRVSDPCF